MILLNDSDISMGALIDARQAADAGARVGISVDLNIGRADFLAAVAMDAGGGIDL